MDAKHELQLQLDDAVDSGVLSAFSDLVSVDGPHRAEATVECRGDRRRVALIPEQGFFVVDAALDDEREIFDSLMTLCLHTFGEAAQDAFGDALAAQLNALASAQQAEEEIRDE